MIGFVVNSSVASQILAGIASAQTSRGLPVYWTTGSYEIFSGPHTGSFFLPASDEILATPLRGCPIHTPMDFPEADAMISSLGGLGVRVDIDTADLQDPNSLN